MLSIVDKVKQNNYRTGRVLQMYIEAIHKARSPAANRLRMTALRSYQPTIERSFLEGHDVGGVDEIIPPHWHCAGSRNQICTPLLACDRVEFKDRQAPAQS
jgi:hypothetical protein